MKRLRVIARVAWIMGVLALVCLAALTSAGTGVAHAQSTPVIVTTPAPVVIPTLTPTPPIAPEEPVIDRDASDDADGEYGTSPYIVKMGDTLLTVAIETGLDLNDAPCLIAPDFRENQPLVVGDELLILPPDIVCHRVEGGETLAGIAARYNSSPAEIRALPWNRWPSELGDLVVLPPGDYLRVPRGPEPEVVTSFVLSSEQALLPMMLRQPVGSSPFTLRAISAAMSSAGAPPVGGPRVPEDALQMAPVPADWPYGSGYFAWPLFGWLSQGFHADHRAIDVAAPAGTLVTAVDRGVVTRAGWNYQGYGNFVVIDHNIDYVTLYAHLSAVLVAEGDVVAQGQPLGIVGSTGNSTGPHLHLEIRDFGRRVDPIELLVR